MINASAKSEFSTVAVHDGRERIGTIIVQSRTSYQARCADGSLLGVFASKREALDAIWTSAGRARGGQDER
jgi:hypothetical protein